ncbi:MBL fold metallo-hydrolase [Streptomyces sodiiphilus]|uniref:MBL fold metallo-hydrolase n=1 Tax=Streptomyces sodiiphilus TaxID=226217 RepID=A0ABN2PPK4_9ACTN
MYTVQPIDTSTLGDRSYLVHDGTTALVVDPQRDIDRVLEAAREAGVRIGHVFETHIHNDYVTGGHALAQETGAAYHVNAEDPVDFERMPVSDGEIVDVSPVLAVRAIATPGHTHTHLSYELRADGRPVGVFTGGSLLFGSTGRPDLLGPEHTDTLVRAQYRSAHRLAGEIPEDAEIFPTHGFGSFCSSTQAEGVSSTIAHEKRVNPVLTSSEADFVADLLAGLDAYPAYYAHMAPANLAGPGAPDLTPPEPADPAELRSRIEAGEWVVDLRSRTAFAAGHLPGSLSFGLDGSFATYLGWIIPWGTPLTLLGETPEQIEEAQRELARIGIDRSAGGATGTPEEWTGGRPPGVLPTASFGDLVEARTEGRDEGMVVLDVRRDLEWSESHLLGAVHIPLHQLLRRMDEVPPGRVWVHCGSGYRATAAASLLAANGRDVVAVNDEFANAAQAGAVLESAAA